MGQYFIIVNLDKKEYIHPHDLDTGAKLWEICNNNVGGILLFLLRQSDEGGGGDINEDYEFAGRWANDKIIVVGDYDSTKLYEKALKTFKNISKEANKEFIKFIGDKDTYENSLTDEEIKELYNQRIANKL